MNNNIAPYYLPQISASYDYVFEQLNNENINYDIFLAEPDELNATQPFVFSDKIENFDPNNNKPIWISKDYNIIDGHHRWVSALSTKKPIECICIQLDTKSAMRVLNKIQDIHDYEEQRRMEEVVTQDAINIHNDMDSGISNNEFLASLEEMETPESNQCKIFGYRHTPIKENSVIGNFFMLNPVDGYDKYEIDFENLLDTDNLGLQFKEEHPVDALARNWFPNVDFDNMSEPYIHSPQELKNKAIVDRAKKMGYDGIKYGDLMIQGLK